MSATSSVTPIPTQSLAISACAASPCSTQWVGTTTVCPPNAVCRTTTGCSATHRFPTTRTSPRQSRWPTARRMSRRNSRRKSVVAISSNCARPSRQKTKRPLRNCSARSDFQSTGHSPTPRSTIAVVALLNEHSFAILRATRPIKPKLPSCGMSTFAAQLHRPNLKIAKCPAHITVCHLFAQAMANRFTSKPRAPNFLAPA
ncbi:unannotated protein [freshwater metagenome]|uniref:Unannotated protein n=1 Tax=freshwater metagenome TaxID=449393 RepID=A0A6J6JHQ8_9ZZZZ